MLKENDKVSFTDHLDELRQRLIVCFVAVGAAFFVSFFFAKYIFDILAVPLLSVMRDKDRLIFDSLTEPIFTYLKISLLTAIFISAPVILYQFWMFVAPGLYKNEKKLLFPIVLFSTFFFLGGVVFGYKVVFPIGFDILLRYDTESFQGLLSINKYMALSSKLLLGFGIVFELPLVITLMARFGIVTVPFLRKQRKYALLLFFVFGAFLTPPDVVSQIAMAVPLMLLYEISIIGAILFGKKKTDEDGEETEDLKEKQEEREDMKESVSDDDLNDQTEQTGKGGGATDQEPSDPLSENTKDSDKTTQKDDV